MQPTCGSWTHDLIHHPIIMGEVPVELVPFFFKEKSNMNWFRLMLQFYHIERGWLWGLFAYVSYKVGQFFQGQQFS